MHEHPLTLITINYNNLQGLQATVASVVNQIAPKKWHWMVIDGGSTDGSKDYLEANSELFDLWVSEPDKGIYDAMNKGLQQVKQGFVWFLNSGDRLHGTNALAAVLGEMETHPHADCFYSDTYFVDEAYRELGLISALKPQKFPKKLTFESFRYGMNICHQSFVVRRELAPFYKTEFRQAADIDWILEILKKRPVCVQVASVLSEFQTGGSSSQHARKAMKERYKILQSHFGLLPNLGAHAWIVLRRFFSRGKY
jgi:glycosyltransferase involved in cell wall biosynthesis